MPSSARVVAPLLATTVTIGAFLLTKVTALRPSLLDVKFLARIQEILPSPSVVLTVALQLTECLTQNVPCAAPRPPLASLLTLRPLLITARTVPVIPVSLKRTLKLPVVLTLCLLFSPPVKTVLIVTRVAHVPAEVMVTLGLVRKSSAQSVLCDKAEPGMPATARSGQFSLPARIRIRWSLVALLSRARQTKKGPLERSGTPQLNLDEMRILAGTPVSPLNNL